MRATCIYFAHLERHLFWIDTFKNQVVVISYHVIRCIYRRLVLAKWRTVTEISISSLIRLLQRAVQNFVQIFFRYLYLYNQRILTCPCVFVLPYIFPVYNSAGEPFYPRVWSVLYFRKEDLRMSSTVFWQSTSIFYRERHEWKRKKQRRKCRVSAIYLWDKCNVRDGYTDPPTAK